MIMRTINFWTLLGGLYLGFGQQSIPMDTLHWDIDAKSYVLENYKGKESIYLQEGQMTLKDVPFLNGTIEYDIFLKEARGFPGVYFRINGSDSEHFYLRPHQSGNPDANQAIPIKKGLSAWQLYFGPTYSFPYTYSYEDWTHVKLKINGNKAQVFLDHSDKPHLSWNLFHQPKEGNIRFSSGGEEALYIANIKVNTDAPQIENFEPIKRKAIKGLVPKWEISDKFEEKLLADEDKLEGLIARQSWDKTITVEEGTAANISQQLTLYDEDPGNTVFAKITISSDKDQQKLFEFGYSDRVLVILNGRPIYKGNNTFRSRDYRYLGTLGLFDAVYLDIKKGKNTLLMAVSESFGGWLVTGRFTEPKGLKIK